MNVWQLRVFCTVARVRSFSGAARLLYLTQPAISAQILSLEKHFGTRLFRRHVQGVELTGSGQAVYQYSQRILELVDDMEKAVTATDKVRKLTVATTPEASGDALPCTVQAFRERNPSCDIALQVSSPRDVMAGVHDGRFDVGVVELNQNSLRDPVLAVAPVAQDELVAVFPPSGQWPCREELAPEELLGLPFVMREPGSDVREAVEGSLSRLGVDPANLNVVATADSNGAVKSAVASGRGISILSRLAVQKELCAGTLQTFKLRGLTPAPLKLVHRRDPLMPNLTRRFIRFLSPAKLS